jgi:hypothetical protein
MFFAVENEFLFACASVSKNFIKEYSFYLLLLLFFSLFWNHLHIDKSENGLSIGSTSEFFAVGQLRAKFFVEQIIQILGEWAYILVIVSKR